MDLEKIVAVINLLGGAFMLFFILSSMKKIEKSSMLKDISMAFLLAALVFILHAFVEFFMIKNGYYATTGLLSVLVLGYAVMILCCKNSISFISVGKK
ncbi:MAG: hypothetical protein AABX05_05080 [Nanoarchaeota archaeon]